MKPPEKQPNIAIVSGTFLDTRSEDEGHVTSDPLYDKKIKDNLIEYFADESIRMGLVSIDVYFCNILIS